MNGLKLWLRNFGECPAWPRWVRKKALAFACNHNYTLIPYKDNISLDHQNCGDLQIHIYGLIARKRAKAICCRICKRQVAGILGQQFETIQPWCSLGING